MEAVSKQRRRRSGVSRPEQGVPGAVPTRSSSNGDLLQASEKGWGAASQIVKAVAEDRGWEHRGHWYLHRAVDSLVAETGDEEIQAQFSSANSLHINFYEGLLSRDTVAFHLRQVTRFIEKVEALLDQGR